MPAYWVARSKINDPVEYKKSPIRCRRSSPVRRQGSARGGRHQIMEGPTNSTAIVVIEFPTSSRAWPAFSRMELQQGGAFRRGGAGEVETIRSTPAMRRK